MFSTVRNMSCLFVLFVSWETPRCTLVLEVETENMEELQKNKSVKE